jgi:ribosome-binding protein aMBF1 (putative translation factor)
MVQRRSVKQERLLKEFGENIRRWRKVNGMSASELASRAFITRETLRSIEAGTASPGQTHSSQCSPRWASRTPWCGP